ncbi:MAG: outer membrane protein assembly factor BamD [Desulfobacteraceae bacterium]|jgi:outer membrane protein assembly factor BamD
MKKISILLMALALLMTGCGWFQVQDEMSVQELAQDGMDHYNRGSYRKAIDSFEKLKDYYPFDRLAILAELKIADAHFMLEEYEEAIVAYEEFANLHPLNEAIPYVIYQIGLCYFNRVDTTDRDQNNALKALETFNRLTRQHPEDPYALKADEKSKECLKSIAGHEFLVGLYYFKSKHYKAALARFRSVLSQYPDVGVHQQALQYIARCEAELNGETTRVD